MGFLQGNVAVFKAACLATGRRGPYVTSLEEASGRPRWFAPIRVMLVWPRSGRRASGCRAALALEAHRG
jgi:hypothetical protein